MFLIGKIFKSISESDCVPRCHCECRATKSIECRQRRIGEPSSEIKIFSNDKLSCRSTCHQQVIHDINRIRRQRMERKKYNWLRPNKAQMGGHKQTKRRRRWKFISTKMTLRRHQQWHDLFSAFPIYLIALREFQFTFFLFSHFLSFLADLLLFFHEKYI